MSELLKTPLFEEHVKLGATMVDFGGWNMPVQYSNVIEEHTTTRTKVGIFDICHMGEFLVRGQGALEFLQKIVTNDISALEENHACYNCLCNEQGFVLDDLFVYQLEKGVFFIVVNAATAQKDFEWFLKHKPESVDLINVSDETAKIDVQGPLAQKTLQKLTQEDLSEIKRFRCKELLFEGIDQHILVSRTGYTGEDGFELYMHPSHADTMWSKLLEAGEEFDIKPVGLGARDTLRIEACYSLYGHEINESITPIEAGLGFVTKFNKDFIGKEVLQKQKEEGTPKKLICFEMIDRAVPREHYKFIAHNQEVGEVSSGTFSPTFKKGIGMGFIDKEHANIDNEISISIRGKEYKAKIVKRPMYTFRGVE